MGWKRLWDDWKAIAIAVVVCLGAFLLNGRAWQAGYRASWSALGGCNLLRLPLVGVAWWTVFAVIEAAAKIEKPPPGKTSVLRNLGWVLGVAVCLSCQFLWPVLLLALISLVVTVMTYRKDQIRSAWKEAVLRSFLVVLLFTLTWYLCASTTRQALYGLGARIEALNAEDRLRAWAVEVIAAVQQKKHPGHYAYNEVPDIVDDLMGRIPGWPYVVVVAEAPDPYVEISNASGYSLRITVCPSCPAQEPQPWWVPEWTRMEWRPGIYLETAGK
jgi:hypothetical protein